MPSRGRPGSHGRRVLSGLRFKAIDDCFDLFEPSPEQGVDRHIITPLGLAKRYMEGDEELVIHAAAGKDAKEYELVLRPVEPWPRSGEKLAAHVGHFDRGRMNANIQRDLVFVRAGEGAEKPQEVISAWIAVPTGIRLLRCEKSVKLRWNLFESMRQVFRVHRKREIDTVRLAPEYDFRSGERGLIQCMPKVAYDMVREPSQVTRRLLKHLQLDELVSRLRIHLSDEASSFRIVGVDRLKGLEFFNVFSRPVQKQPRTVKRTIGHAD